MMTAIALGSDHAGFELKTQLGQKLRALGYEVHDFGSTGTASCDYPDYAHATAAAVADGRCPIGVLVCGSANGVAITANKHHGVRAAIAWLPEIAQLARQHNNANILCLPARFITEEVAMECLRLFLETPFEGGRHQARVQKIEP